MCAHWMLMVDELRLLVVHLLALMGQRGTSKEVGWEGIGRAMYVGVGVAGDDGSMFMMTENKRKVGRRRYGREKRGEGEDPITVKIECRGGGSRGEEEGGGGRGGKCGRVELDRGRVEV